MAAEKNDEELLDLDESEVDGTDTPDNDSDDDFEFDDEGNLVIPDDDSDDAQDVDLNLDDEEDDDGGEQKTSTDPEQQDNKSTQPQTDVADDGQSNEPAQAPVETKKDDAESEWQKKYLAMEKQVKATLKALGNEDGDPMGGLEQIAAEADGKTPDEYRKEKAAAARDEEARKLLQQAEFEKMLAADLDELHKSYPETANITSITQIENFELFGKFRDSGLTVKQAYAAANPDKVRASVATAVKQQNLNATKDHLKSAVPKQTSGEASTRMTKAELHQYRDMFPELTDKQIVELYKRTKSK